MQLKACLPSFHCLQLSNLFGHLKSVCSNVPHRRLILYLLTSCPQLVKGIAGPWDIYYTVLELEPEWLDQIEIRETWWMSKQLKTQLRSSLLCNNTAM